MHVPVIRPHAVDERREINFVDAFRVRGAVQPNHRFKMATD